VAMNKDFNAQIKSLRDQMSMAKNYNSNLSNQHLVALNHRSDDRVQLELA